MCGHTPKLLFIIGAGAYNSALAHPEFHVIARNRRENVYKRARGYEFFRFLVVVGRSPSFISRGLFIALHFSGFVRPRAIVIFDYNDEKLMLLSVIPADGERCSL